MDWDKAKTFAIFLFLILNAVLFILTGQEDRKYQMTAEQYNAIYDVLIKNDIQLQTDIPKDFSPRKKLTITKISFDYSQLVSAFFEDPDSVKRTLVDNRTVFKNQTSSLLIDAEDIVFENNASKTIIENLNENAAKSFCDDFIKKINLGFEQLTPVSVIADEDTIYLNYYERYNDTPLYFNYIEATVSKRGIKRLSLSRYVPEGYTGQKHNIYSADEALFSMLRYFKNQNIKDKAIWKMELGYALLDEIKDITQNASPFYMIYTDSHIVMVNAYTNEVTVK